MCMTYVFYHYRPNGVAARYRNDLRQQYVNHEAAYIGSGIGTASFYGVPGTGINFGYGRGYGYRQGGYPSYGFGINNDDGVNHG